jgi:hypothetical protein
MPTKCEEDLLTMRTRSVNSMPKQKKMTMSRNFDREKSTRQGLRYTLKVRMKTVVESEVPVWPCKELRSFKSSHTRARGS